MFRDNKNIAQVSERSSVGNDPRNSYLSLIGMIDPENKGIIQSTDHHLTRNPLSPVGTAQKRGYSIVVDLPSVITDRVRVPPMPLPAHPTPP
jgi:hypothetical protein